MKKILFVEDDLMIIRIYRGTFQTHGYEVEVAIDGEAALEYLKKNTPDAVVLDLQLPKVNGVEVLKFIRSQPRTREIPVIVFSNAFLGRLVEDAWKAGATKCLTKASCTPKQFLKVLETTLASAPARIESGVAAAAAPVETTQEPIPATDALAQLAREANSWASAVLPGAPPTLGRLGSRRSDTTAKARSSSSLSSGRPSPLIHAESLESQSQAVIRRIIAETSLHTLTALRSHLVLLRRKHEEGGARAQLGELFRTIHALTGNAALGGLTRVAELSSALEALIQELDEKPHNINASSLRTLSSGVDALGHLFASPTDSLTEAWPSALSLVVDQDLTGCRGVCAGLEKANLRSIRMEDPELALHVLERNPFDLIFLDVEAPRLNGFELTRQIRAFDTNRHTPIIFITIAPNFDSRASSMLNGGTDLISKPFLLIELAVKALTYLIKAPPATLPAAARSGDAATRHG